MELWIKILNWVKTNAKHIHRMNPWFYKIIFQTTKWKIIKFRVSRASKWIYSELRFHRKQMNDTSLSHRSHHTIKSWIMRSNALINHYLDLTLIYILFSNNFLDFNWIYGNTSKHSETGFERKIIFRSTNGINGKENHLKKALKYMKTKSFEFNIKLKKMEIWWKISKKIPNFL